MTSRELNLKLPLPLLPLAKITIYVFDNCYIGTANIFTTIIDYLCYPLNVILFPRYSNVNFKVQKMTMKSKDLDLLSK